MALLTETLKQSSCLTQQGDVTAGAHTSVGELKGICWLSFRAETVVKNKLREPCWLKTFLRCKFLLPKAHSSTTHVLDHAKCSVT